jgi:glycosyltransferase involved in cell wall biosynthesis
MRLAATAGAAVLLAAARLGAKLLLLAALLAAGLLVGAAFLLAGRPLSAAAEAARMGPLLLARARQPRQSDGARRPSGIRAQLRDLPRWLRDLWRRGDRPPARTRVAASQGAADPAPAQSRAHCQSQAAPAAAASEPSGAAPRTPPSTAPSTATSTVPSAAPRAAPSAALRAAPGATPSAALSAAPCATPSATPGATPSAAPSPAPSAAPPSPESAAGRRLRLLVLSARLPRLGVDGSWGQLVRLLDLADRHDVTLFALLDEPAQVRHVDALRARHLEVITHLRGAPRRLGNAHHQVPRRLAADYSSSELRAVVRGMLREARHSGRFDLLQVEYAEMAHMFGLASQGSAPPQPTVYVVHEPISRFHLREYERARGAARVAQWFRWAQSLDHELAVLQRFDHVVTVSDVDEAHMRSYLPQLAVTTIPNAVDTDRIRPLPEVAEQPYVTFVGYYGHPPNVDAALWLGGEIFPLVRAQVPHARLRLLGAAPPPAVRALGDLPGIEVAGYVAELLPAIAESAVMAVPIRLGGGLRGKVLEAWGAAKALVTTARGAEGFPVVHGDNALVGDDTAAFAAHLTACLRDPALRQRLGQAGHRVASTQFTRAAVVARYEALYRALLAARGRADGGVDGRC